MQTNPAVEQNKNIKWSESPWNQSGKALHNNTYHISTTTSDSQSASHSHSSGTYGCRTHPSLFHGLNPAVSLHLALWTAASITRRYLSSFYNAAKLHDTRQKHNAVNKLPKAVMRRAQATNISQICHLLSDTQLL